MGIQKIQHKSRPDIYEINFPANESLLSWSFKNQADGEIYFIEGNNVSSVAIDGVNLALGSNLSFNVLSNKYYPFSINKTEVGKTSSLKLYVRRANIRFSSINIPDFVINTGRFLYILAQNNIVLKYDTELLKPSNYNGVGSFVLNPLIGEIVLPNVIDAQGYAFTALCETDEDIFVLGSSNGALNSPTSLYFCKIKSDGNCYNLQNEINSVTSVFIGNPNARLPNNCIYDPISKCIFFKCKLDANISYSLLRIDTQTGVFSNEEWIEWINVFPSTAVKSAQINPVSQVVIGIADHDLYLKRMLNYKITQNNGNKWGFTNKQGKGICVGSSLNMLNFYNENGLREGNLKNTISGASSIHGCTQIKGFDNYAIASNANSFSVWDLQNNIGYTGDAIDGMASPNNYLFNFTRHKHSNLISCLCGTSSFVGATRVLLFDMNLLPANPQFGYLNLPNNAYMIASNQIAL